MSQLAWCYTRNSGWSHWSGHNHHIITWISMDHLQFVQQSIPTQSEHFQPWKEHRTHIILVFSFLTITILTHLKAPTPPRKKHPPTTNLSNQPTKSPPPKKNTNNFRSPGGWIYRWYRCFDPSTFWKPKPTQISRQLGWCLGTAWIRIGWTATVGPQRRVFPAMFLVWVLNDDSWKSSWFQWMYRTWLAAMWNDWNPPTQTHERTF